jgi:hypothetical protein
VLRAQPQKNFLSQRLALDDSICDERHYLGQMQKEQPTPEYLHECFDYDPETGGLTWKVRPREHFNSDRGWRTFNSKYSGKEIRSITGKGYRHARVTIGDKVMSFYVHVIAHVLMTKSWPTEDIDHKNRHSSSNEWNNLRPATRSQNIINQGIRSDNTTGVTGVSWHKKMRKYRVRVHQNRKEVIVGYYDTLEEATAARKQAAQSHYGEFANVA